MNEKYGALDIVLMRYALNGVERSALFLHGSPPNDVFLNAGAGIYFFYLRVNEQEAVRVEIPVLVAGDSTLVDVVQASILVDTRMTGYSYVLSQAHQHAVIPAGIAQTMQNRTLACYWQALGRITPQQSAKIGMKQA